MLFCILMMACHIGGNMSLYESTLARIVPRNKEIEQAIGEQWSQGTP